MQIRLRTRSYVCEITDRRIGHHGKVDRFIIRGVIISFDNKERTDTHMNRHQMKTVAADLDQYMTFRAAKDNQEYTLSATFVETGLKKGCLAFFGVEVEEAGLICDHKQPKMFIEWIRIQ